MDLPCEACNVVFSPGKQPEEIVVVCLKDILEVVMCELNVGPPVNSSTCSEDDSYHVSIKLNTPFSQHAWPKVDTVVIDGEVCHRAGDAETSAVLKSFEYLKWKRYIEINDRSTVKSRQMCTEACIRFSEAQSTVQMMQKWWPSSLIKAAEILNNLKSESKFVGLVNQLEECTKKAGEFLEGADKKGKQIVSDRDMYMEEARKGNSKGCEVQEKVEQIVPSKFFVQQIVSQRVGGGAKFSTNYIGSNKFKGTVEIPASIMNIKYADSTIKFDGEVVSSITDAEEAAAGVALAFMDEYLRLDIIDLNYETKQVSKKNLCITQELKKRAVMLGSDVHSEWLRMNRSMLDILTDYKASNEKDAEIRTGASASNADGCVQAMEEFIIICTKRLRAVEERLGSATK